MKVVQLTVRYVLGGSDLRDVKARTNNVTRARMYRILSAMSPRKLKNIMMPPITHMQQSSGSSSIVKFKENPKINTGADVIANEDMRHSNCSVGDGN